MSGESGEGYNCPFCCVSKSSYDQMIAHLKEWHKISRRPGLEFGIGISSFLRESSRNGKLTLTALI